MSLFGAERHLYCTNRCIEADQLNLYEEKMGINLPEEYKFFLKNIGNGGAGPFYGIFPLEKSANSIRPGSLLRVSPLSPNISDSELDYLVDLHQEDKDEEFSIFDGILRIGNQGCGTCTYLVLSGEFSGRVINLDEFEFTRPIFDKSNGFFEWYFDWINRNRIKLKILDDLT